MERKKWKSNKKEPPKILIPDIPKRIFSILSANGFTLLTFYHNCAIQQNTDQIYCTNTFVTNKKGLGWGDDRLIRTKNELRRLGLIEDIQKWKKGNKGGRKGDFEKKYIKLFFVMEEDKLITAETQRHPNGRSMYTNSKKSRKVSETQRHLNEAGPVEQVTNALEKHNKHTSGTHPPSVVPSVQKKEEVKDTLPLKKESSPNLLEGERDFDKERAQRIKNIMHPKK